MKCNCTESMTLYQIKDWDMHFENHKSRDIEKCSWCCLPNKQDGLGYGTLMSLPNGPAMYGAFVAMILVCSKHKRPRRGLLTADGTPAGNPLSARHLSVKTKMPEKLIQQTLEAVTDEAIGWILEVPSGCLPSAAEVPPNHPYSQSGIEGKKEGKGPGRVSEAEKVILDKELDRIIKRVESLKGDYRATGKWANDKHSEYKALLVRRDEIRKTLGLDK